LKKALLLISLIIILTACKSQKVNGVWMSYNNYIIDSNSGYSSGDEGVIIDFDKQTIEAIFNDNIVPINIDFKKSKLFMKTDTINVDYKVFGKDSIEIDFGTNMMHVFRPLNLNHKLSINKNQIENFLIKNDFGDIFDSLDIQFTDKFFIRDVATESQNKRKAVINKNWGNGGYWYVKEIRNNFYLIFTIDEISENNIYQIKSIDDCKMELKLLQEDEFKFKEKLTKLKTCL
jgi:hypothetical protein